MISNLSFIMLQQKLSRSDGFLSWYGILLVLRGMKTIENCFFRETFSSPNFWSGLLSSPENAFQVLSDLYHQIFAFVLEKYLDEEAFLSHKYSVCHLPIYSNLMGNIREANVCCESLCSFWNTWLKAIEMFILYFDLQFLVLFFSKKSNRCRHSLFWHQPWNFCHRASWSMEKMPHSMDHEKGAMTSLHHGKLRMASIAGWW